MMVRIHPATFARVFGIGLAFTLLLLLVCPGKEQSDKAENKDGSGRAMEKVRVVAERFNFTPSQIKVKQGALLEITLTSDDTFHGFRIASAKIDQIIPARGRGNIKVMFEAKEKGTFVFECSRPCGAGHTMMRGVIVVE